MLTMTDIHTIKNLRKNHDKSINHIRKELGVNWRTAKKYADQEDLPQPKLRKKTGMMYDEPWGERVALWLSEDAKLPRKKRRTNLFLYEQLNKQGFPGSYRTVCVFIQEWKATHSEEIQEDQGFERLEHPPGEAQLDFGTMEVVHKGAFKTIKALIMTFPYSNAGFAVALPAENQECLFEGLKELFRQIGGVPHKIRIDNMSTAVVKAQTKNERASLTSDFLRFTNHYRFETQVCNPRSGHEKGSVENKVGYIRYHFFSETPVMVDFASFNQSLARRLTKDRQREHYEKRGTIEDLWLEEQQLLYQLPEEDYPVFKEMIIKANKYNEITLDGTRIHVPRIRNYSVIYVLLRFDSYQLMSGEGELITEGLRPYMHQKRAIHWQSILMDWRRKIRAMPYSRYWKYLPERIKLYLSHPDWNEQRKRIDQLLNLLVTYSMIEIGQQFYDLMELDQTTTVYDIDWNTYDSFLKTTVEEEKPC